MLVESCLKPPGSISCTSCLTRRDKDRCGQLSGQGARLALSTGDGGGDDGGDDRGRSRTRHDHGHGHELRGG